jgi:hypothetical protein
LDNALEQGQQALHLARELAMRGEEGCSLRVLGEIAAAQNHLTESESLLVESITILTQAGDEYETARSRLALAHTQAAQDNSAGAAAVLDQCWPVFERLDAALDLAAARRLRTSLSSKSI